MRFNPSSMITLTMALLVSVFMTQSLEAQRPLADQANGLQVEGRVARTFKSPDGTQLVEIHLSGVALEKDRALARGFHIPTPGDALYVVVDQSQQRRLRTAPLPAVGATVSVLVRSTDPGIWIAQGDSFTVLEEPTDNDPDFRQAASSISVFGMQCEAKLVGGQLGAEVIRVTDPSPAKEAGFQTGDIVIGVNTQPLASVTDLQRAEASGKTTKLSVVDVNSGKIATVVLPASVGSPSGRQPAPKPDVPAKMSPAEQIATSLGITVEASRSGFRRVVKVSEVTPSSPGAQAGLEPGDVIVAVGGAHVSNVDGFAAALPEKAGELTLMVRDVRTGRDVPIKVQSNGSSTSSPSARVPDRQPPATAGRPGSSGISAELTFYDAEAAVKVVSVAPGSAADRAGIRPGMILLSANGKPLLHPDELAAAEKSASGRFTLRVVNPSTKRESTVALQL